MYRGWSNSNDRTTRGKNHSKVPVLHAKQVSDGGDKSQSNADVNRKLKAPATPSPKLKLVFQLPLNSDKILSKSKTEKRTNNRALKPDFPASSHFEIYRDI